MKKVTIGVLATILLVAGLLSAGCGHRANYSPLPAAPTGVSATGGVKQVTVTWNAVAGATSYNIYWSTSPGGAAAGTKIAGATSPFVQTGLADGTTYYYVVRTVNTVGEGAPSGEVSAITLPAPPAGVNAAGGANQVTVSWLPSLSATSYNIYWSTVSGTGTGGNLIANAASPYPHTGLTNSTTFYYVVTAANASGESAPSPEAFATTNAPSPPPGVLPAAPTGLTATGGVNQVALSWNAVATATSYKIYWKTTAGVTTADPSITVFSINYLHTFLAANTAYYYKVSAVNAIGEGPLSGEASATTAAIDGVVLYNANCSACHGALGSINISVADRTANGINEGVTQVPQMNTPALHALTQAQISAIASVLGF